MSKVAIGQEVAKLRASLKKMPLPEGITTENFDVKFNEARKQLLQGVSPKVRKTFMRDQARKIKISAQPPTEFPNAIEKVKLKKTVGARRLEKSAKRRPPKFKVLKRYRVKLTPEERKEVIARKAVWHWNGNGPTSAIWKAVLPNGDTWYGCNTHRAWDARPTLKGALSAFKFIKTTA